MSFPSVPMKLWNDLGDTRLPVVVVWATPLDTSIRIVPVATGPAPTVSMAAELGSSTSATVPVPRRSLTMVYSVPTIAPSETLKHDVGRIELNRSLCLPVHAVGNLNDAARCVVDAGRGMNLAREVGANLASDVRAVVGQELPEFGRPAAVDVLIARAEPVDRVQDRRMALDDHVLDARVGVRCLQDPRQPA